MHLRKGKNSIRGDGEANRGARKEFTRITGPVVNICLQAKFTLALLQGKSVLKHLAARTAAAQIW